MRRASALGQSDPDACGLVEGLAAKTCRCHAIAVRSVGGSSGNDRARPIVRSLDALENLGAGGKDLYRLGGGPRAKSDLTCHILSAAADVRECNGLRQSE